MENPCRWRATGCYCSGRNRSDCSNPRLSAVQYPSGLSAVVADDVVASSSAGAGCPLWSFVVAAASVDAISVIAASVTVAYTVFLLHLFVLSALNRGADGASGVLEVARNNFWPPKLTSLTGSIVNFQSCLEVVAVRLKKKQPPSFLKS